MNIEEFVRSTLSQIDKGMDVDGNRKGRFFLTNDGIAFDLAVTVSSESEVKGGASGDIGIRVANIGGKLEGIDTQINQTVSRIRFTIDQHPESYVQ
ncbi:hypothetical protein IJG66_00210 [Candidatus Saccharibacteria bacterium]|nr:hypothetical protein [Candidatus Saccharibacteria bacterium]